MGHLSDTWTTWSLIKKVEVLLTLHIFCNFEVEFQENENAQKSAFVCLFVCLLVVLGWRPPCHRKTLEPWPTGGKCPVGSRGSPYSQRGHIRWPSLPPWQRDSTYSPLRSDKPTRLTRVGPDLIRYRRPHIAAMHTTRCTVSDMPRLRIMGKNPLPYRLLITLSPSIGSLSQRSRRNQVLRQLCIYACMGGLTSNSYVLHHLQAFFMKEREMRHKHSKQKQPQSSEGHSLPGSFQGYCLQYLLWVPFLGKVL